MLLAYYYSSSYVAWVLLVLYNLMIMIHAIDTLPFERRSVCRIRRGEGWGWSRSNDGGCAWASGGGPSIQIGHWTYIFACWDLEQDVLVCREWTEAETYRGAKGARIEGTRELMVV